MDAALPLDTPAQPPRNYPDMRRVRGTARRDRILAETRALIVTGTLRPTVQAVAKLSGCSLRTVFMHFATHDRLLTAALDEPTRRAVLTLILRDSLFPSSEADCERLIRAVVFGRV